MSPAPARATTITATATATATPSPTTNLPEMMTPGPVYDRWLAAGGMTGELGKPVHPLYCTLARGGCFQAFAAGNIYQGPTGVWVVPAASMAKWGSRGWEAGTLGYPTSDRWCTLPDGGCFQRFERGNLYTAPGGAQYIVDGAVLETWGKEGWESGHLGYPTSDLACGLRNGGCLQRFAGGVIYRVPSGQAYYVKGAIFDAWGAEGWEGGHLGYPTSSEQCWIKGGCFQTFTGGSVYWSPAGGAHPVYGEIGRKWGSTGWEGGQLGYPITDEFCGLINGGCVQEFRGGLVYWSMNTGAHFVKGAIRAEYAAFEWERYIGYPTTDEYCGLKGGACGQEFEYSAIYFVPRTGTHVIDRPLFEFWVSQGAENSPMGYPIDDTYLDDSARPSIWENFEFGYLESYLDDPSRVFWRR